ncbi:hypothetical protein C8039_08505 [Halogeometricum sp. wsp3]|nr:hypothetical protein C8039_08505 [Halogeometricum sp. wsp3]
MPVTSTGQRQSHRDTLLRIRHVNESDDLDVEIEGVYEDTEADPSTGSRKAQSLVTEIRWSVLRPDDRESRYSRGRWRCRYVRYLQIQR